MKNNLIGSVLVVFLFWYAVLLIASWSPPWVWLTAVTATAATWAVAWPLGVGLALAHRRLQRLLRRQHAVPSADAVRASAAIFANPKTGETVPVPLPRPEDPPRGNPAPLLKDLPWFAAYRAKHPLHAQALWAVLSVMQSKPGLPAAAVAGGHGGATLWQHSLHVLQAIKEEAPRWRYEGLRNSRGVVIVPVQDISRGFHDFAGDPLDHPLLFLAALAHDIGKVACYDWKPGAPVKEIKPRHGEVGAALLRTLPEIQALPLPDRDALLLAVRYYHEMGNMPIADWISDLARSLTALLYRADCIASVREGGAPQEKIDALKTPVTYTIADQDDEAQAAPTPDEALQGLALAEPVAPDEAAQPQPQHTPDLASPSASPVPAAEPAEAPETTSTPTEQRSSDDPAAVWSAEDGRTARDVLDALLREPGAVNGKQADRRMAIKHGQWLYIFEPRMRRLAAQMLGDPDLERLRKTGVMHPFTKSLLLQLDAEKLLFNKFEGLEYGPKRGVWVCQVGDQEHYMIIVRAELLPMQMDDAKYAPRVLRNVWGPTAARNKREIFHKSGEENDTSDNTNQLPAFTVEAATQMVLAHELQGLEKKGGMYIDLDDLRSIFEVDENNLPEGCKIVYGQQSKKHYLCFPFSSRGTAADGASGE